MGHCLIEEFCRAKQLHPDFIHKCQRVFREEVQAQLDERDTLLVENASLKAEVARLSVSLETTLSLGGVEPVKKAKAQKGTGDAATS